MRQTSSEKEVCGRKENILKSLEEEGRMKYNQKKGYEARKRQREEPN